MSKFFISLPPKLGVYEMLYNIYSGSLNAMPRALVVNY